MWQGQSEGDQLLFMAKSNYIITTFSIIINTFLHATHIYYQICASYKPWEVNSQEVMDIITPIYKSWK